MIKLGKTVITSDIHGCYYEFKALMRKTELNKEEDTLLILGDLFDRGRHSFEVCRELLKLREEMGERFILVRGNHDQFLMDACENPDKVSLWAFNGGMKTVESFKMHGASYTSAMELLRDTPLYYETDRFIGVHAGLRSENPAENDAETLMWDRSVTRGSYRGKLGIGGHTPMRDPIYFNEEGIGITLPYESFITLPEKGFICMDTGCVFGRKLTALVVREDTFECVCMKKMDC